MNLKTTGNKEQESLQKLRYFFNKNNKNIYFDAYHSADIINVMNNLTNCNYTSFKEHDYYNKIDLILETNTKNYKLCNYRLDNKKEETFYIRLSKYNYSKKLRQYIKKSDDISAKYLNYSIYNNIQNKLLYIFEYSKLVDYINSKVTKNDMKLYETAIFNDINEYFDNNNIIMKNSYYSIWKYYNEQIVTPLLKNENNSEFPYVYEILYKLTKEEINTLKKSVIKYE